MSRNKTPTQSPCDNVGKYEPILIVISVLHSLGLMNCGKSYYVILHLTSNLLPHYLAKFECSTVQLCTIVIRFKKSVTDRLFTLNIYRNIMFCITCLCQVIYNTVMYHVFKISAISMYSCFVPCTPCHFVNGCVNVAMLCQAYSRRCRNLLR